MTRVVPVTALGPGCRSTFEPLPRFSVAPEQVQQIERRVFPQSIDRHVAQAPRSVGGRLPPLSARKEAASGSSRASCQDCKAAIFGTFTDGQLATAVLVVAVLSFVLSAAGAWLFMSFTFHR